MLRIRAICFEKVVAALHRRRNCRSYAALWLREKGSSKTVSLRKLILLIIMASMLAITWAAGGETRTVRDMAGREVIVPRYISKVYCMTPASAMLIYTLAPERLMAWPSPLQFNDKERSYLTAPVDKLPLNGGLNGNTISIEELVKLHPDVVMMMVSAADAPTIERLQQIQKQSHIPTFLVDMRLRDQPRAYELLGDLLGTQARAADLANYCRAALNDVENRVKSIPIARRPHVYYAGGVDGLQTIPRGVPHSESIEIAGGINVDQLPHAKTQGRISIEQLLNWNPDIIIVARDHNSLANEFYRKTLWNDPLWKSLQAVRNHSVYEIPSYPFGWVSPPASVNRILGIKWLASLFYPDRFNYDMRKEAKEFYAKFYRKQLSEAELDELLQYAHR
jgi:iron complex transport system substrate-binding protein